MTIPTLLAQYFPTGLLGLGLTALMASFMSGMAGNVTAFNTVWTYDIYQSYIAPGRSPTRITSGWAAWRRSSASCSASRAAYLAAQFNNIMDMLQLVFGFVNAPLFATFLLGMFWKRATGHGAFFGLLGGTLARGALPRPLADRAGDAPASRAAGSRRSSSSTARWARTSGWPSSPGAPALR